MARMKFLGKWRGIDSPYAFLHIINGLALSPGTGPIGFTVVFIALPCQSNRLNKFFTASPLRGSTGLGIPLL